MSSETKMVPLLTENEYAAVRRLRREMEGAGFPVASPFLPIGPNPRAGAPIRVLIVGQATRGPVQGQAGPDPSYRDATERSREIFHCYLNTPFWMMAGNIIRHALSELRAPEWCERLPDVMGWTNLVKIGVLKGNPDKLCIDKQKDSVRQVAGG